MKMLLGLSLIIYFKTFVSLELDKLKQFVPFGIEGIWL